VTDSAIKKNIKNIPNHIDNDFELVLKEGGQNNKTKNKA
jgi:hypothetical protein